MRAQMYPTARSMRSSFPALCNIKKCTFMIRALLIFAIVVKSASACPEGQFECDLGACKLNAWKCDGVKDCTDGTDEAQCDETDSTTKLTTTSRSTTEMNIVTTKSTPTTVKSITTTNVNSNKSTSTENPCNSGEFQCNDGNCIPKRWLCDSGKDCLQGEDELNCTTTTPKTTPFKFVTRGPLQSNCTTDEFACVSDGKCIRKSLRCNRKKNCEDLSDEFSCGTRSCSFDEFRCKHTKYCIRKDWVCDNKNDCLDGSDEECIPCLVGKTFKCDDGLCIKNTSRCDRIIDCLDGSDEVNCTEFQEPKLCESYEFSCVADSKCFSSRRRCDFVLDCSDGSDEEDCETRACELGEFQCKKTGYCILPEWLCDGFDDCFDGTDEANCTETTIARNSSVFNRKEFTPNFTTARSTKPFSLITTTTSSTSTLNTSTSRTSTSTSTTTVAPRCTKQEFHCEKEDICISLSLRCNRKADCEDYADEIDCNKRKCDNKEFLCKKTGHCIFKEWVCDNHNDCVDGSDEEDCSADCGPNRFMCGDGLCLPDSVKCDTLLDCYDGSDEQNCTEFQPAVPCSTSQFQCHSDLTCIKEVERCNKVANCKDASDEFDCNSEPCKEGEFQCEKTKYCMRQEWLCDGFNDCMDNSDEHNCTKTADIESTPAPCGPEDKNCQSIKILPEDDNRIQAAQQSGFKTYQEFSLYVNTFPRKWLRAKEICEDMKSRLAVFPNDKKFSQQFKDKFLKENHLYGLNFWVGRPKMEAEAQAVIRDATIAIPPAWMLNGRQVNNTINPMFVDDCYFMDHLNLEIFRSRDCYDHAAFICEKIPEPIS